MKDWLDDLSEDWPSQPPSLNVSQTSKALNSSTSKIPRPSRLSGTSSVASRKSSRNVTNGSQRRRSILGERSVGPNSINNNPGTAKKGYNRTSVSSGSVQSNVIYSTVEVRSQPASPVKNRDENLTPEWKRRLLQGDGGYGQQKDLFGPTGIQSLFQKPQETPEKQRKTTNLSFLKHLETIPSSPPASFMRMGSLDDSFVDRRKSSLDVLAEDDETRLSSRQSNRQETVEPLDDVDDTNSVVHHEEQEQECSVASMSLDRSRKPSMTLRAQSLSKRTRDASGQSVNDSFSAVFISKHNTADGGIAYAPIDMSRSELVEQLARLGMSNGSGSQGEDESNAALDEPSVAQSEELPTDLPVGTPDMISMGEFVTTRRGGYSQDGSFRRRPLSPSPLRKGSKLVDSSEEVFNTTEQGFDEDDMVTRSTKDPSTPPQPTRNVSTFSRFGENELDDHEFPEDFSQIQDEEDALRNVDDLPSRSPSPDVMPPGSQQPLRFRVESPVPPNNDTFKHKRKGKRIVSKGGLSVAKRDSVKRAYLETIQSQPDDHEEHENDLPEGKRPPPSPFKHSTPKRRRTLMEDDITPGVVVKTIVETHVQLDSVTRPKRKDSRTGSLMMRAGPDVLAQRQILRPRNPTPSQRRWNLPQVEIQQASDEIDVPSSSPRLQSIQKHLNVSLSPNASSDVVQGTAIASELAAFSEKIGTNMDDSRKRSVTTQDFLDEALKIMNFIRTKGKPASELSNVMESYLEDVEESNDCLPGDESHHSSFSRPPSREDGKGGWRTRDPLERTPSAMQHLAKYQDSEDGDFIRSSIASTFGKHLRAPRIETLESEPSGLEIIAQTPGAASENEEKDHYQEPVDSQRSLGSDQTTRTQTSGDSSLGRTTASRKSETVATIPPEAVASIIPDSVAGYKFDKERNIWVKQRRGTTTTTTSSPNQASSPPVSEEDPFSDIPDLTYDPDEEAKRLNKHPPCPPASQLDAGTLLRKHMEANNNNSSSIATGETHRASGSLLSRRDRASSQEDYKREPSLQESQSSLLSSSWLCKTNHPPQALPMLRSGCHYSQSESRRGQQDLATSVVRGRRLALHSSFHEEEILEDIPGGESIECSVPISVVSSPRAGSKDASQVPVSGVSGSSIPQGARVSRNDGGGLGFDECVSHDAVISPKEATTRGFSACSELPIPTAPASSPNGVKRVVNNPHHLSRDGGLPQNTDKSVCVQNSPSLDPIDSKQLGSYSKISTLPPRRSVSFLSKNAKQDSSQGSRDCSKIVSKSSHHSNTSQSNHKVGGATREPVNNILSQRIASISTVSSPVTKQTSSTSSKAVQTQSSLALRSSPRSHYQSPIIISTPPVTRHYSQLSQLPLITLSPPKHSINILPVTLSPYSSPAGDHYSTLLLSELSDFTINQIDETTNPTRAIVKRTNETTYEDKFAWGNHLLSKALMDNHGVGSVFELETSINLANSGLVHILSLATQCPKAIEIDVSSNKLTTLNGLPSETRKLNASDNFIHDASFHGCGKHLQELNLSSNQLTSLLGFHSLNHLTVLNVRGNKIRDMSVLRRGLLHLQEVDLSRNSIIGLVEFPKLSSGSMYKLRKLNLSGNKVSYLQGVENLGNLEVLDLSHNMLQSFEAGEYGLPVLGLRELDLSHNLLEQFRMAPETPDLELLNLEGNSLTGEKIRIGFAKLLGTLNLRKQNKVISNLTPFIRRSSRLRTLLLGGNRTKKLAEDLVEHAPFHHVEYLELASCCVTKISPTLAQTFPNLIALNMNFNTISSLENLEGFKNLQILLLAGNHITKLRDTVYKASGLPNLQIFDTRGNPFSANFYEGESVFKGVPGFRSKHDKELCAAAFNALITNSTLYNTTPSDRNVTEKPRCSTYSSYLFGGDFTMPTYGDRKADEAYKQRLVNTNDTHMRQIKLRRDTWDIMIVRMCSKMMFVDGLPLTKDWVKHFTVNTELWEKLLSHQIVKDIGESGASGEGEEPVKGGDMPAQNPFI